MLPFTTLLRCTVVLLQFADAMFCDLLLCTVSDEKDQWIRSKYEQCDFLAHTPYTEVAIHRVNIFLMFLCLV